MPDQEREIRRYNRYIDALLSPCGFGTVKNKERNTDRYVQEFLNRTQAMYRYEGLPETTNRRTVELYEQINGFVGVIEYNGKIYTVNGGLGGVLDQNYFPTEFIVANPYLKLNKTYKVNEDCVIIPNDPLLVGLLPIMWRYAEAMAEDDLSIYWATVNARINTVFAAGDETTRNTAKAFIESLEKGEIGVITDPKFTDEIAGVKGISFNASSAVNGAIISLMELKQYHKGSFYMDIGIKSPFNMKREALGDSENGLQDASLLPLIDIMTECRKEGWKRANEMFGLNVRVDLASAWEDIQEEPEHNMEDEEKEVNEENAETEENNA